MEDRFEGAFLQGLVGALLIVLIIAFSHIKGYVKNALKEPSGQKGVIGNFKSLPQIWRRGLIAGTIPAFIIGFIIEDEGGFIVSCLIYWVFVLVGCWVVQPVISKEK